MKQEFLNDYSEELTQMRQDLRSEIKDFFERKGNPKVIKLSDTGAGGYITINKIDVDAISRKGMLVDDSESIVGFDEMGADDLSYIAELLNDYIAEQD